MRPSYPAIAIVYGMSLLLALGGCGDASEVPPARAIMPPVIYEGKIVRQPPSNGGKKDGWFLVQDGQRRWISNTAWLHKNGYTPDMVLEISAAEFNALGENPLPME